MHCSKSFLLCFYRVISHWISDISEFLYNLGIGKSKRFFSRTWASYGLYFLAKQHDKSATQIPKPCLEQLKEYIIKAQRIAVKHCCQNLFQKLVVKVPILTGGWFWIFSLYWLWVLDVTTRIFWKSNSQMQQSLQARVFGHVFQSSFEAVFPVKAYRFPKFISPTKYSLYIFLNLLANSS